MKRQVRTDKEKKEIVNCHLVAIPRSIYQYRTYLILSHILSSKLAFQERESG